MTPPLALVTVKYFLSNPTSNNAAYNLVTSDCTGTGAALTCSNNTKFGNLRFYLGLPEHGRAEHRRDRVLRQQQRRQRRQCLSPTRARTTAPTTTR